MQNSKVIIINQLEAHIKVFESLLANVSNEQALWKPAPDQWSLLEVICHLVDEEVHDFRARVNTALFPDQYSLIPIDPANWVISKKYLEQDYEAKLSEWLRERKDSVIWLRSLKEPDWNSSLMHPDMGKMSASLFLTNWLAHDHIHIRQINRTKRAYLAKFSDDSLEYAGKW